MRLCAFLATSCAAGTIFFSFLTQNPFSCRPKPFGDLKFSCFIDVKDSTAKIQNYLKAAELSEQARTAFENLDIGDIVGIKGKAFKTRTGEPTIHAEEFTMLSKSIRPLPEKWHGLVDEEERLRE